MIKQTHCARPPTPTNWPWPASPRHKAQATRLLAMAASSEEGSDVEGEVYENKVASNSICVVELDCVA